MKKKILPFLMCVSLISLTGCNVVSYQNNLDAYVKELEYRDGFTILQLTDIHWNGGTQIGDSTYGSKQYITKLIEEVESHVDHLDLIEVTGDTFMLANKAAVTSFIDFMEEDIGLPYAMLWGNHDREGKYHPNWISKQFLNAKHCLYTEVDNDDVHERGNYVINLKSGDDVKWQIINLDSGASYRKGAGDIKLTYDYIRQDQLDWMSAEHHKAGDDVPAMAYYHIAQKDFELGYQKIKNGEVSWKNKFFKAENFGASKYASEINESLKANKVRATFIGHDHSNDWTFTNSDDITYGYGVKTGHELYYYTAEAGYADAGFTVDEEFEVIGGSLVTLQNATGDFKLEHVYLNERDNGDFVKWVEY